MNSMKKTELLGMNMLELEEFAVKMGQPRFRGRQLHRWIYVKDCCSFYEMSDIPRELRQQLDAVARISIPRVLKQRVSADGTRKFLMEMNDKKRVETVLIPQSSNLNGHYTRVFLHRWDVLFAALFAPPVRACFSAIWRPAK